MKYYIVEIDEPTIYPFEVWITDGKREWDIDHYRTYEDAKRSLGRIPKFSGSFEGGKIIEEGDLDD